MNKYTTYKKLNHKLLDVDYWFDSLTNEFWFITYVIQIKKDYKIINEVNQVETIKRTLKK